ncbi:cytochrome b5-related protein [Armadillidium vulgare]|nr:cytochrome b5-related protein [Armadillidium vulgare]
MQIASDDIENILRVAITSPITKYPSKRDIEFKSAWNWLEGKREDDGVYPYWRIHDKLYDLSEFVDSHPGGKLLYCMLNQFGRKTVVLLPRYR